MRLAKIAFVTLLVGISLVLVANRVAKRAIWAVHATEYKSLPTGSTFVVTEAELASVESRQIGAVGFPGSHPQLISKSPLNVPPGHPFLVTGGVFIVETVIGPSGRIVKARVLRGIETPVLRAELVRCLREWKFDPAMYQGTAWPVYWNITLPVQRSSTPVSG